jgi:NDP-sugar pyrophosphorylase family protein
MNIAILCGGVGSRMESVLGSTPKILAPIEKKKFIDFLIEFLMTQNQIDKIYWLLGVGALDVREYIETHDSKIRSKSLYITDHKAKCGTGASLINFVNRFKVKDFLCIFGDSLPQLDLESVYTHFANAESKIGLTFISKKHVKEIPNVTKLEDNKLKYSSPGNLRHSFVDYGVTYFNSSYLLGEKFMKENDIKEIVSICSEEGYLDGLEVHDPFIEIGTPLAYAEALMRIKEEKWNFQKNT